MQVCLLCLPSMNDEVYQAIICLHIVWGRIKPLKCSISVNDLELHKNINYYAVKDVLVLSEEAGVLSSSLWWWSVGMTVSRDRECMYN